MVSAHRVPAAGRAFDSVRNQQGALRHAQRHHGREEKGNRNGYERVAWGYERTDAARRENLRSDEVKENRISHWYAQGNGREARGKTEVRSKGDLTMKIL